MRVMTCRSLWPRTMRATSERWTTPLPWVSTTMSSRSRARSISLMVRTRYSAWPSWSRPPVRLTFSWARRVTELLDAQPEAREPPLVDLDLDLLLEAPGHEGRRHPVDALEQPLHLPLADQAQPHQLLVAGEPDPHHRVERGVVAQDDGTGRLVRQLEHVEPLAHVERGEVHLGAPGELEGDLAQVGAGAGAHGDDPVHDAHRVLDGAGEQGLDLGRGRSLELGADAERGVGDVGQQVDRQVAEGDHAEHDRGQREHDDRDRTPDREVDDPQAGPARMRIGVPSLRPSCPTTMTLSPSWSPERTSTRSASS